MWSDAITGGLERSRALDRVGKALGRAFSGVVRPGRLKDLLSGTWLAHPLHPMLTDVTVGAWTGALLLDVVGGEEPLAPQRVRPPGWGGGPRPRDRAAARVRGQGPRGEDRGPGRAPIPARPLAGLAQALLCLPAPLLGEVVDLLALRLAALPVLGSVFLPCAPVTAPTLGGIDVSGHHVLLSDDGLSILSLPTPAEGNA